MTASPLDAYRVSPSRYCLARFPGRSVAVADLLNIMHACEPNSWLCGDRRCTPTRCVSYVAPTEMRVHDDGTRVAP